MHSISIRSLRKFFSSLRTATSNSSSISSTAAASSSSQCRHYRHSRRRHPHSSSLHHSLRSIGSFTSGHQGPRSLFDGIKSRAFHSILSSTSFSVDGNPGVKQFDPDGEMVDMGSGSDGGGDTIGWGNGDGGVCGEMRMTTTDAHLAINLALDSVVKIFTMSSSPNYFQPWQNKVQRETTGSGFVITGKRILTNAHVVANHTFVQVRKHGSSVKYKAEVLAVGHECDLAILVVETEEFWHGMHHLELGSIPFLQEEVAVVGYPQGGDNISVTKGVVSRVELTQYIHGATQLIAIQIDAAINPGNSGGPAIMGNKIAGVAFQNLAGAENIGYIIPVPVIRHFISGVEESGKYIGFCSIGLSCQSMENEQLREHFEMQPQMTGVLVSKINPLSDARNILRKDDILLAFDHKPVANDGTVIFRNRERIIFDHLVSMKKPNEKAEVRVLREGIEYNFTLTLRPLQQLVPVHQFDTLPSYYIFAGLVFVPLTQPFLHEFGEDWYNTSPRKLCERSLREQPRKPGEQLVILSQVLTDEINTGYERLAELQVNKVNGVDIDNLKQLCRLVEGCKEESLRFDLDDDRVIALNYEEAKLASSRILARHRIPSALSSDLIVDEEAVAAGESQWS